MQKLLKQNQKNLTAFDQTKITNITDEYENYNKNKDDADVNIKEKRQDMQEALETAVQKHLEKIQDFIGKVNSDELIDDETPISEALKKISLLEKDLESIQKKQSLLEEQHGLMQ